MYSAPRSIQAVALAFVCFVSGSAVFPQTAKFIRRTADPVSLANVRLDPPRCAGDSRTPAADLRATIVLAEDATSTCDSSPRADASLVNPCNSSSGVRIGCNAPSLANVIEIPNEGGPSNFRGVHLLRVGPYMGDTLPAQVVALLHEFGHVLDLLPRDGDDQDGKSAQNTSEVLRFCRAAVESKGKRSTLSAAR